MSKPYILELTISCDEYIPDFLGGKLGIPLAYKTFEKALADGEKYLKDFISWLENDPSCNSKPKYAVNGNVNVPDCNWICNINDGDAWFKVSIHKEIKKHGKNS